MSVFIPATPDYNVGGAGDPFGGGTVNPTLLQTAAPTGGAETTPTGPDPLWLQTTAPGTGGGAGTVDPALLQGGGITTDTSNPAWVQTNPITNTPALASGGQTGPVGGRVFTQEEIDMYNSMGAADAQQAVTDGLLTFDEWYGIQHGLITAGKPANAAGGSAVDPSNPIAPGSYFADAQVWDVGGPNDPFTNPGAGPKNYQKYYQNTADSDAKFYQYLADNGQLDSYWENMYADELALLTGGQPAPEPVQQPLQIDPAWLQQQNLTSSYANAMASPSQVNPGLSNYFLSQPQQVQPQQVDPRFTTQHTSQPLYFYG